MEQSLLHLHSAWVWRVTRESESDSGYWCLAHSQPSGIFASCPELVPASDGLGEEEGRKGESCQGPGAGTREFREIIAVTIKSKSKTFKGNSCQRQKGAVPGARGRVQERTGRVVSPRGGDSRNETFALALPGF